jgi:hypothetical protein
MQRAVTCLLLAGIVASSPNVGSVDETFSLTDCTSRKRTKLSVGHGASVAFLGATVGGFDLDPAWPLREKLEKFVVQAGKLAPNIASHAAYFWSDIEFEFFHAGAIGAPISGVRWATGNSSASADLALHPSVAQRMTSFAASVVQDPVGVGAYVVNATRSALEEAALAALPPEMRFTSSTGRLTLNPFAPTHIAYELPAAVAESTSVSLRCSVNCALEHEALHPNFGVEVR